MEISEGIVVFGYAIFIKKIKTLVVSDLQLGKEEMMRQAGLFIIDNEAGSFRNTLDTMLNKTKAKRVIINGDLKHEFGKINRQEWKQLSELLRGLRKKAEVIIVKGNHDILLRPIAESVNISIKEYYYNKKEKIYFTHGHKIPEDRFFKEAKTIIIGHEHPAILLDDGIRREYVKCFLVGRYKNKKLIVIPSFSNIGRGVNILREEYLSPFLKKIDDFKVYVPLENLLYFGKIKELKKIMNIVF